MPERKRWKNATPLLSVCLLGVLLYGFWVHANLIVQPFPIEFRENAIVMASELIEAGRNPYQWSELPTHLNVYGPVYSTLMAGLLYVFDGHDLLVHRITSGVLILGSVALVIGWLRARKLPILLAAVAGLLLYMQLLRVSMPTARPDPLGLFLLLLCLFVVDTRGLRWGTFTFCLLCSVAAGLSKPYFGMAICTVLVHAALTQGWRKALGYSAFAIATGGALLWALPVAYPALYYSVLQVNAGSGLGWHWLHLAKQIAKFGYINAPLLAALAWSTRIAGPPRSSTGTATTDPRTHRWAGFDLVALQILIACLLLLKLAQNTGSDEYFFHLLTPFFIVWAFARLSANLSVPTLLALALVQCLLYLPRPPTDVQPGWQKIEAAVAMRPATLAVAPVARVVEAAGGPVYDTGQSEFFKQGLRFSTEFSQPARARLAVYQREVADSVQSQAFAQVITAKGMPFVVSREALQRCYALQQELLEAPMYYTRGVVLEVWLRRSAGCTG